MVVTATTMADIEVAVAAVVVACLSARCWALSRVQLSWGPPRRRLHLWCIQHRLLRLRQASLITRIVILLVTELAPEPANLAESTLSLSSTLAGNKSTTRPDKNVANLTTQLKPPNMKPSIRIAVAPALLALACFTTSAWAQTTAASDAAAAPSSAASAPVSHAQKHADFVEKRINDLHAQMQITSQQAPQWDAFAQTMRDNAAKTDQAFHERAHKLPSENADDAMKSYAELAQLHADNMQKLAASFSALYATLSDEQKTIADPLFRNDHAKRHAGPRKHKPAASAPAPASN